jgi:hypothetical protein
VRFGGVPVVAVKMPALGVSVRRSSQYGKNVWFAPIIGRHVFVNTLVPVGKCSFPFESTPTPVNDCP